VALALSAFALRPTAFAQAQVLIADASTSADPAALPTPVPSAAPTPSASPSPDPAEASEMIAPPSVEVTQPELDPVSKRLFGVIPNYRADQYTETYKPLTLAEKYKIARNDSFDWPNFPLLAGYALQSQVAAHGFTHNGGVKGFGEYYVRGFGDQVIGTYLTEAILPGLLHEDPRFFRIGTGTFFHRVYYATSRVFVTRTDNGGTRLYVSEIFGNMGVVAITSLYYPASQTVSQGSIRYAMQLGNDAVSNILTEFWPDIKHRLRLVKTFLTKI
jgi:hypothetical protein